MLNIISKRTNTIIIAVYVSVLAILFLLIHAGGRLFPELEVRYISYTLVCVCALFSIASFIVTKRGLLISLAFMLILIGDLFLVLLRGHHEVATSIFFVAQILIVLYLAINTPSKALKPQAAIRAGAIIVALIIAISLVKEQTSYLIIISAVYFATIICSSVFAGLDAKNQPLIFIGLVFFTLCDFFVGLNVLTGMLGANSIPAPVDWVWVCYPPALALLTLSPLFDRRENVNVKYSAL